jgi:hypothetical protein
MKASKFLLTSGLLAAALVLAACGLSEQDRMRATVNAAVVQTQTVVATLFTPTPPPTPIPTDTPDPGEMIPREFSISPPFDWATYDLSGKGINIGTTMLYQGYLDNPALACAIQPEDIAGAIAGGLRLVATNPTASADHCIYLTVSKSIPVDNVSLEEFAALKADELAAALVGKPKLEPRVLRLNYVEAAELIYEQPIDAEGERNQTFIHYFVLGPRGVYQLTFVTPVDEFKVNYAEFTQMMQNFQVEDAD